MIPYASNTGTRRNLDALRTAGWRILLTPDNATPRDGLQHGVDNGAWKAFQQGTEFDGAAFRRVLDRGAATADFIVVPDIVGGGLCSLELSLSWLDELRGYGRPLLLPVQDGMESVTIEPVLLAHPQLGIFAGGTTAWKIATMCEWGHLATRLSRYFHVGRVNSAKRIWLCAEAGAHSFDGTSATMYAETLPLLDHARRARSLFEPTI